MQNFAYLIGDLQTRECLVVDPAWDVAGLLAAATEDGMTVTGALVTHYHPDHCGGSMFGLSVQGLATLLELNPCKSHVHRHEAEGVRKVTGLSASDLVEHDSGDMVKVGAVRGGAAAHAGSYPRVTVLSIEVSAGSRRHPIPLRVAAASTYPAEILTRCTRR